MARILLSLSRSRAICEAGLILADWLVFASDLGELAISKTAHGNRLNLAVRVMETGKSWRCFVGTGMVLAKEHASFLVVNLHHLPLGGDSALAI